MKISPKCGCGCNERYLDQVSPEDINKKGVVTILPTANLTGNNTPFQHLNSLKRAVFFSPTKSPRSGRGFIVHYKLFKNCPNLETITFNEQSFAVKNLFTLDVDEDYYFNWYTYLVSGEIQDLGKGIKGFEGRLLHASMQEDQEEVLFNPALQKMKLYVVFADGLAIKSCVSMDAAKEEISKLLKFMGDTAIRRMGKQISKNRSKNPDFTKSINLKRKERFFELCRKKVIFTR